MRMTIAGATLVDLEVFFRGVRRTATLPLPTQRYIAKNQGPQEYAAEP